MATQTLRELLKETPNIPIKIKTISSRWIYAYYNDNSVCHRLAKESSDFIQSMQHRLLARVEQYNSLDRILKRKLFEIKHSKTCNQEEKAERTKKARDKYNKDKELLPKVIENQKDKIKSYIPYLDRKVKRVWTLPCMKTYENPKTLYIEIVGKEIGNYDDIHDYAQQKGLPLRKDEYYWGKALEHRKKDKENKQKELTMVKVQKGVQYKVVRDENGVAQGLVEIKPTRKGKL